MSCLLYLWTKEVGLLNFAKFYFIPYIVRFYLLFLTLIDVLSTLSFRITGSSCWRTCIIPTHPSHTTARKNGLSFAVPSLLLIDLSLAGQADSSSIMSPMTTYAVFYALSLSVDTQIFVRSHTIFSLRSLSVRYFRTFFQSPSDKNCFVTQITNRRSPKSSKKYSRMITTTILRYVKATPFTCESVFTAHGLLRTPSVLSTVHSLNAASLRMMATLFFTRTETERLSAFWRGRKRRKISKHFFLCSRAWELGRSWISHGLLWCT